MAMTAETTWITSQGEFSASVSGATAACSQITATISTETTKPTTIGAIHSSASGGAAPGTSPPTTKVPETRELVHVAPGHPVRVGGHAAAEQGDEVRRDRDAGEQQAEPAQERMRRSRLVVRGGA